MALRIATFMAVGLILGELASAQVLQTRPNTGASTGTAAREAAQPQTPRQAVIEILKSKDDSAVMRHLPEATKKKMKELGPATPAGFDLPSTLGAGAQITAQAERNGSKVDIEEAGPV